MAIKELIHTIFKSFNPDSYKELTERKFSDAMKYFGFITFWALLIMFLLFIPALLSFPVFWQQTTSHFDKLSLNYDVSVKNTFNILSDPIIKVSKQKANMTDEKILITEDNIYYKQFFFFGKTQTIPLEKQTNVLNQSVQVKLGLTLVFLIPSLFFWSFVGFTIYFWIIIFITFLIGLLLSGALRLNHPASRLIRIAVYSSTVLIVVQLILLPFFRLLFMPLIAYWILFLVIIIVLREEKEQKQEKKDIFSSRGSKTKQIFSDQPKKDSYEIDEKGNSKSSALKKKKSFNEDNDDYVELK